MFNQRKNDMKITEQTFIQMEDAVKRMALAIHDLRNETSENIYNLRRKNLALDAFMIFNDASDISEIYDRCVEMAQMIEHAYKTNE